MTAGPAMKSAAYVMQHPGCSKADVHEQTGISDDTIDRALEAGLIRAVPVTGTREMRYRLYPPQAGKGVPQS